MIDIGDPGFYGLWFISVNSQSDFLGALFKKPDGNEFLWRMRYYDKPNDFPDPFEDNDRKSWHCQKSAPDKSIEETLEDVRRIVRIMTQHAEGEVQELLLGNKSVEEFVTFLSQQPWAHMKSE